MAAAIQNAVQKLEYTDVATNFGTLAPLIGRPNVHSIRALENQCITKAMSIANPNAPNMGYAGIFMNRGEYAMSDPNPYIDPPNPGATPNYNVVDNAGNLRFLNENDRAIIKATHAADLILWSNNEVVHRVIKEALDRAIPNEYKPSLTIGQRGFGNRSVREIFEDLYDRYGTVTPADIKNLTLNLYKEWNPSVPIESFLLNIETQQVFATKAGRPFHQYLLIEAALNSIKDTRQFKDELREWNRDNPDSTLVQWHNFKRFWIDKYAEYERDRATMQDSGYHGASNTEGDDGSLASLTEAFTSLQSHRTQQDLALQSLLQEVSSLRQLVGQQQQQQAANMYQAPPHVPSNIQFPPAPPTTAYQPPPPPPPAPAPAPAYQAPPTAYMAMPPPPQQSSQYYAPPQQQTSYNQNNGGGRNRGRNSDGRGQGNNSNRRNNPQHPVKRFNNWLYCSSCGFDTSHDGNSCTNRKNWHVPSLTRDMKIADMHRPLEQQQYRSCSHAGHHKRFLPSQAAANGYPQYQRDS
jgi:hypothetical protein